MAEGGQNLPSVDQELSDSQYSAMETDALELLLQRNRSERENELREIQNSSRPVTGQSHRDQISHFMAKNLELREHVEAAGKENVPLNTVNVEQHRPEAVVVEIQGLSQQQRVSSALQTAAFRRHLENLIRGSISRVHSSANGSPASTRQPSPPQTLRPSPVPEQVPQIPSITEYAGVATPDSNANTDVSDRESISSGSTGSYVNPAAQIRDPRGLLALHGQNTAIPPPPPPPPTGNSNNLQITWNDVSGMHQESIVQEISELVHQRLVTSSLEGEFRTVLEYHMRDRLQTTGTDGQRVQDFIQSIPQSTPHIHNDFSHLGIPAPPGQDNFDNISVTSISATTVPYRQTNLHLSQEIAGLKAQMTEMRNMLKVSFELQMDIQRSIRQEVAAGIAAATGQSEGPVTISKSKPVNDTHCLICLDNFSDSVLYQCGHMCVCYPCGRHLMDRNAKCPVCRAPIRDIIRAYRCNED